MACGVSFSLVVCFSCSVVGVTGGGRSLSIIFSRGVGAALWFWLLVSRQKDRRKAK